MVPFHCPSCRRSFLVPDDPEAHACPACRQTVPVGGAAPSGFLGELARLRRNLAHRVQEQEAALRRPAAPRPAAGPTAEPWYYRWAGRAARFVLTAGAAACGLGVVTGALLAGEGDQPAVAVLARTAALVLACGVLVSWSCAVLVILDAARTVRRDAGR